MSATIFLWCAASREERTVIKDAEISGHRHLLIDAVLTREFGGEPYLMVGILERTARTGVDLKIPRRVRQQIWLYIPPSFHEHYLLRAGFNGMGSLVVANERSAAIAPTLSPVAPAGDAGLL